MWKKFRRDKLPLVCAIDNIENRGYGHKKIVESKIKVNISQNSFKTKDIFRLESSPTTILVRNKI